MQMFASADSTAKVVIVVVGALVVVAFVAWKVYAVVKAAKTTQGSPEDKHKAIGRALHGKAYGAGHDAGRKAGEKLAAWLKRKK